MVGYPYTMGQYNSKNEEIILAQAGANQQIDDLKEKLDTYGIAVAAAIVCVVFIIFCFCCKRCNKCARKWIQDQLQSIVVVPQVSATKQGTEQNFSTPSTKVVFS